MSQTDKCRQVKPHWIRQVPLPSSLTVQFAQRETHVESLSPSGGEWQLCEYACCCSVFACDSLCDWFCDFDCVQPYFSPHKPNQESLVALNISSKIFLLTFSFLLYFFSLLPTLACSPITRVRKIKIHSSDMIS